LLLRARCAGSRRLAKGAQKGAAHAVAIGEAGLPGDDIDRMPALLHHHQPDGFDMQIFDRLGRRLARLCAERAAELARTERRLRTISFVRKP
jgi:hypothetical protein